MHQKSKPAIIMDMLLKGGVAPPDNDSSSISLVELKEALTSLSERYQQISNRTQTLHRDHGEELQELEESLDKLEQKLIPLEKEFVEVKLHGDPVAMAIHTLQNTLTMIDNLIKKGKARDSNLPNVYQQYLERNLLIKAEELAAKPCYEKCIRSILVHLADDPFTITITTSMKTGEFCDVLKKASSQIETIDLVDNAFLMDAGVFYFYSFINCFQQQLLQLPHLAALFYNDCNYFSLLTRYHFNKKNWDEKLVRHVETLGARILQQSIDRQMEDLQDFCPNELFGGSINRPLMAALVSTLEQGSLRIKQLANVFKEILDEDLKHDIIHSLCYHFLGLIWKGLLQTSTIDASLIPELQDVLENLAHLITDVLGAEVALCRPNTLEGKLSALSRILGMTLIQLSNAFRREEFSGILEYVELLDIVNFLYPNTAMKKAFMAEIEAEL